MFGFSNNHRTAQLLAVAVLAAGVAAPIAGARTGPTGDAVGRYLANQGRAADAVDRYLATHMSTQAAAPAPVSDVQSSLQVARIAAAQRPVSDVASSLAIMRRLRKLHGSRIHAAPSVTSEVAAASGPSFDWGDAGIGIGIGVGGTTLLALGGFAALRRRQHRLVF